MTPRTAMHNVIDRRPMNTEVARDQRKRLAGVAALAYRAGLLIGELRRMVRLPARDALRMQTPAVTITGRRLPFACRITRIVLGCTEPKVGGIYAVLPVSARTVMERLFAVWYRAVGDLPCYAVGFQLLPADLEEAIAVLVSCRQPQPASVGATRSVGLRPQPHGYADRETSIGTRATAIASPSRPYLLQSWGERVIANGADSGRLGVRHSGPPYQAWGVAVPGLLTQRPAFCCPNYSMGMRN
jgi:hypothetical protein